MKKINNTIYTAFNMLKYAYPEINGKRFKNLDVDVCNTLDDLYSLVLAYWIASLAKEGLYKEYVEQEPEEMTSPHGQINIRESISNQTMSRGTLVCQYDELSENIFINHVIKGILQYVINKNVGNEVVRNEAKKTMQLLNGVEYIDIKDIKWKSIKYNNNNIRYKHLIVLCKTVLEEQKLVESGKITDNERLYLLFKKQILTFCKENYEDTIKVFDTSYELESEQEFEIKATKRQYMTVIETDTDALVLMVRFQDKEMMKDTKIGRQRLEELVRHLRTYKKEHKLKTSGVIIYVNTDATKINLQPITTNVIDGYMVGETVVDIHDQWKFIRNKIDDAYAYFIGRTKTKIRGKR